MTDTESQTDRIGTELVERFMRLNRFPLPSTFPSNMRDPYLATLNTNEINSHAVKPKADIRHIALRGNLHTPTITSSHVVEALTDKI